MNEAILAMLSQKAGMGLPMGKALLLIGLQNDFLTPDGKYPISVPSDFWPGVQKLVTAFREHGQVIWVRSEHDATRVAGGGEEYEDDAVLTSTVSRDGSEGSSPVNDGHRNHDGRDGRDSPVPSKRKRASPNGSDSTPALDALRRTATNDSSASKRSKTRDDRTSDFFLSSKNGQPPICVPGSPGAEPSPEAAALFDSRRDLQLTTSRYSAFASTPLLLTLRSKLITEVLVCGCPTNSSVYATAMDAARYGIRITLIYDCLLARTCEANQKAIDHLRELIEARVKTSAVAIEHLKNPPPEEDEEFEEDGDDAYDELPEDEGEEHTANDLLEVEDNADEEDDSNLLASIAQKMAHSRQRAGRTLSIDLGESLRDLRFSPPTSRRPLADPSTSQPNDKGSSTKPRNGNCPVMHDRDLAWANTSAWVASQANHSDSYGASEQRSFAPVQQQREEVTGGDNTTAQPHTQTERTVREFWRQSRENLRTSTGESKHNGLNAMAAVAHLDQKAVNEYENMMQHALDTTPRPLFGVDKVVESAGSTISYNLLPADLTATVFDRINNEIVWQRMYHQTGEVPRLVCCQGSVAEDGSRPVYRHPSDQTMLVEPWTTTVDEIRKVAEEQVGHPLNHALIQLYRTGADYISEHSDKTLDIAHGSSIVNVSFGAERTMRFRTKRVPSGATSMSPGALMSATSIEASRERTTHRISMPHNSMIKLTLETNAEFLHGITADKRPAIELSAEQKAYNGQRISLTFRNIATFVNAEGTCIWGQGATGKEKDTARPVIKGDATVGDRLIRAFGAENQSSRMQWAEIYGDGFDVLHLK